MPLTQGRWEAGSDGCLGADSAENTRCVTKCLPWCHREGGRQKAPRLQKRAASPSGGTHRCFPGSRAAGGDTSWQSPVFWADADVTVSASEDEAEARMQPASQQRLRRFRLLFLPQWSEAGSRTWEVRKAFPRVRSLTPQDLHACWALMTCKPGVEGASRLLLLRQQGWLLPTPRRVLGEAVSLT